jgi:hypothetical protein
MMMALLLGLLHGPVVAMPAAPEAAIAPPCHESVGAAVHDAQGEARELPDCCPDGCDGGCMLVATDIVAGTVPAPGAPESAPIALPPEALASGLPDRAFHPPRPVA